MLRSDTPNYEKFSKVLRAMAMVTYLGPQLSGYIDKIVKKFGNTKLVNALLMG
jgi:hypothetical protein